jgi:polar amino acid transport system permease protein
MTSPIRTSPIRTADGVLRKVVPARHPWRTVFSILILLFAAAAVWVLVTNPNFEWDVVAQYLFAPEILSGVGLAIMLTVIAMVLGTVLGTIVAIMRLADNPVMSAAAWAYVWFFRGTPLLVQLVFWYNLAILFPRVELGFVTLDANVLITPIVASILGLTLNQGAYMAEIVRAGIVSVDPGQVEAAKALGMKGGKVTSRIVLPQALRVIIPPAGNETITMLKSTSLVSVVAVADLMYQVNVISAQTFQTIPILIVATLWYLAITSVMSVGQAWLERHFTARPTPRAGGLRRMVRGTPTPRDAEPDIETVTEQARDGGDGR